LQLREGGGDSFTPPTVSARDYTLGPASLHLDLSLGTWAADGLLAIFFFVVGLKLKREFAPVTCATPGGQRCPSWPRSAGIRAAQLDVFGVIEAPGEQPQAPGTEPVAVGAPTAICVP
jgi:Na+:H+ antiporter, NhaA family